MGRKKRTVVNEKGKLRIQFDASEELCASIDELSSLLNFATRGEAIRKAIWVFSYLIKNGMVNRSLELDIVKDGVRKSFLIPL